MFIAPQLGFAMPLIELCAPDGAKVITYKSDNWVGVAEKVHFPKLTRMELLAPTGMFEYRQFQIRTGRRITSAFVHNQRQIAGAV